MRCLLFAAAMLLGTAEPTRAATYTIDPQHTQVAFLIDHLGFSRVLGVFGDIAGSFSFDPANIGASKLNVTIKTASLHTQSAQRDLDLQGADWFDVTEFPEATFVGKSYSKKTERTGTITGNLTLLGTTRPVTLAVTFNKAGPHLETGTNAAGFSATASLRRSDFGMKADLPYIGDDVALIIEVEGTE
jgi:polyisoprenoid-binding protein YceI